jgi:acyl-CoA synthetase (AMP-forming)/AMP-acid ligase II
MSGLRPTLEFRRGDELVAHAVAAHDAIWFQGHFPGSPLLPGVALLALVDEALSLFWGEADAPPVAVCAFRRIRFRQRVVPGTNLRVRARRVQANRIRFAVEAAGLPACTGECEVVTPTATGRASLAHGLDAPCADRGETAFSSDGTTFGMVAARAAGLCLLTVPGGSPVRVCVASEDRVDVAAAVLAALAGGIEVVFPSALASEALLATSAAHRFSHWIGPSEWFADVAGFSALRIDTAELSGSWRSLSLAELDVPRVFLQTGGSTGQPRLWQKTARNLLGEVFFHVHALQVGPGDHVLATVPPHHIYGLLFSVLLPLFSGATVECVSPFFPREIAERIEQTAATVLVSTPAHLRALAAAPPWAHHLRLVLSSGAPLAAADSAGFFARTGLWPLEVYGSTETGGIAVRRQDVADSAWAPLPGVDCRTEGDALAVRSAYVSGGAQRDADGFFRMADLANIHPDGRFDLLGRDDGVVKVGGKRVELPAIEKAIISLDKVVDAVVLALPSESGRGQEIVALVASLRPAEEIVRELRARLPPPAWPRRLRCVDSIPTTPSGKRDRVAILRILDAVVGD